MEAFFTYVPNLARDETRGSFEKDKSGICMPLRSSQRRPAYLVLLGRLRIADWLY